MNTRMKLWNLPEKLAAILGGMLITLVSLAAPLAAQDSANDVRALNTHLLQLHGAVQSAGASENAAMHSQAAAVIAERGAALASLMREDPGQALTLAFSQDLLDDLKARFPHSASQLEQHGAWQGRSTHMIFDDPSRNVRRWSVRIRSGNEVLEINSATGEPGCHTGQVLKVEGVRLNHIVAAESTIVQADAGSANVTTGCSTTGVQNTAVLLVDFPGVPLPATATPANVWNIFFATGARSVNTYWQEASYGKTSMTGNVFGPYTLDRVYNPCSEYDQMRAAAFAAADADVNFLDYSRVFIIFPGAASPNCWPGMATLGCGSYNTNDGSFTASVSWLRAESIDTIDKGIQLAAHEGGHNLTLFHAASLNYGTEPLGNTGLSTAWGEYGDRFNTMGSWNFGHYSAPHKAWLGWLTSGTNYQIVQSSASFTIQPLETSPAGLQALKVQRGTNSGEYLWIEYRQPIGQFDSLLNPQVYSGALIHYESSPTNWTYLLDFTPGSLSPDFPAIGQIGDFDDPALAAGLTWNDPYTNLSLNIGPATASGLTVNVSYGSAPPACTTAQPAVSVSPLNPTVSAGSSVNYTVSVINNDSPGCNHRIFSFAGSFRGSSTNTTFSPTTLTLSSGQSGSVTMTLSVPTGSPLGTSSVSVRVFDAAHDVTANANVTVATCSALAVFISFNPTAYAGNTVKYIVQVTNNDSGGCTSSVFSFESTQPGWAATFSPATLPLNPGQSGGVTMTLSVPPGTAVGNYPLNVRAFDAAHSATATATATVAPLPACTAAPTVSVSPLNPTIYAGSSVNYTITVANNDTAGCNSSYFSFQPTQPGWPATFPATLPVSPGTYGTATMTLSVPAGTATGTYPVNVRVFDATHNVTAAASVTVNPISITLSATPASVRVSRNVAIAAAVTAFGAAQPGSTVNYTLTKPSGSTETFTGTTDSSGNAVWNYKPNAKGTYSVKATGSYGAYSGVANTITFYVY